tara:strand:- start:5286 stop:5645 length:360 start_codon:yes stop_codon:yes gene_type:complete
MEEKKELVFNYLPKEKIKFKLSKKDRKITFPKNFCYSQQLLKESSRIFEIPLAKSYMSQIKNGNRKSFSMVTLFKLCVLLDCEPSDFFNWKSWRKKANSLLKRNPKGYKISNEDIKNML